MIKSNKILDKINARIESIQSEDASKYPADYKQHLSVEEAVYKRIKNEIEFQTLTSIEKQAKRIEYLASCRKVNGNCENKLKTINIYESIIVSMPYIKALNHNDKLLLLEGLCIREIEIIDDNLLGDIKKHVTVIEIQNAFKPYFEKISPFKVDMLKECYEKIENLYNELLKLNETA